MPRPGELTYFRTIGEEGRRISVNKPFSNNQARFFLDLGALFSLLPPPPARVLECGCGTGWVSRFLAKRGYEVVGQDCAQDAIDLARDNPMFIEPGAVSFECSDYEDMSYHEEFDAVVFYASLHHAQREDKALRCAYAALKPNGVLIAVEPGLGHEKRVRWFAQKYDVLDRDMPPLRVTRLGKKIGFRKTRVFQHSGQLASVLYGEAPHSKWLRFAWHLPGFRPLVLLGNLLFWKHLNGIIWMQK